MRSSKFKLDNSDDESEENSELRTRIEGLIEDTGTRISNYETLIDETSGNEVANAIDELGNELESSAYNPDFKKNPLITGVISPNNFI